MWKAPFVVAAALALTALSGHHAAAAAYCAYGGGAPGGAYENCGFYTWEQCLANISGMGGHCMRNPHDPALWGYPAAPRPIATERRRRYP
jgi:Protein of unknown function (DUF3551)